MHRLFLVLVLVSTSMHLASDRESRRVRWRPSFVDVIYFATGLVQGLLSDSCRGGWSCSLRVPPCHDAPDLVIRVHKWWIECSCRLAEGISITANAVIGLPDTSARVQYADGPELPINMALPHRSTVRVSQAYHMPGLIEPRPEEQDEQRITAVHFPLVAQFFLYSILDLHT